jgi:lipid-binding SYLF domain-containing protein
MHNKLRAAMLALVFLLPFANTWAADYPDTISVFKNAGASGVFYRSAYGYAVFPTVGKAGFWIGGAYGDGRVYVGGMHVGDTSMTQLTVGFQFGGQAYSQIIFFQDKRAFDNFSSGNFEFSATASAVAITAGASASTSTIGTSAGASGGQHNATTAGTNYNKGMAIFTVAKGGLMYEAVLGGQKFTYKPR